MQTFLAQKSGSRRRPFTNAFSPAVEPLESRRLLAASMMVSFISGAEITDGDTTPSAQDGTDFGQVPVGTGQPINVFQVTNTSTTDALTLSNLAVPAGFAIVNNLPP